MADGAWRVIEVVVVALVALVGGLSWRRAARRRRGGGGSGTIALDEARSFRDANHVRREPYDQGPQGFGGHP